MTQKIAVAILHGAGTPDAKFADQMIDKLSRSFAKKLSIKNAKNELVFGPVHWSSIFEPEQSELWNLLKEKNDLDYPRFRRFVIEFLADAVAYQPTQQSKQSYDQIHSYMASVFSQLKDLAGPEAPLCIISHSLGTIVASNYVYDLQFTRKNRGPKTIRSTGQSPLEQCHTLNLFYTLGSPMALWTLRYIDFGSPISVPSPKLKGYYPNLKGEWINFYDKDDILAFPLKTISPVYDQAVTEDAAINTGGLLTSWNPLSHFYYSSNEKVINRIAEALAQTWKSVNE